MPAVPVHHTETTEAAWDGPAQKTHVSSDATAATLADVFAWRPADADEAKSKSNWKFVHHMVATDGTPGKANVAGCTAGIGVLNGGMGGTTIPDADRKGVYAHLAAHLKDADKEPPELKSARGLPRAALAQSAELRTRSLVETDFVFRAATADTAPGFAGHAAVFNSRTAIGNPLSWGFFEQVASSAFDKTLKEGDARFLVDHDTALLVARVSAGDLRLSTDKVGLAVDADLDQELSYVRDLTRNLETRRMTGMSFGFRVIKDDWQTEEIEAAGANGKPVSVQVDVRTLLEVALMEVSAVSFPAYEDTDAGLRHAALAIARRGDPALLARRADPDFLAAYSEVAPWHLHGAEPTERTTPDGEPGAATRELELVQMRHRHLAAAHRLSKG